MRLRVVLLACLGGFLFGYDLGVIGGAMLGITNAFSDISSTTQELIVGAAKLGAFFGTFLGGVSMLRYGRRRAIALQAAFFVAGPVVMAAASGAGGLVAGRAVVGLGIGASAIVVPTYLAEIAPPSSRGSIVQLYEVMLTLGMLCAQLVNALLSTQGPGAWRYMLGLPAVPGAFLLLSLLSLPESPKWLVMRGELDLALATLHRIIASKRRPSNSGSRRQPWQRQAGAAAGAGLATGSLPRTSPVPVPAGSASAASAGADAAAGSVLWGQAGAASQQQLETPEDKAFAEAEDELMWLWSNVQKEQAAGAELRRQAAAAAAAAAGRAAQHANGYHSLQPAAGAAPAAVGCWDGGPLVSNGTAGQPLPSWQQHQQHQQQSRSAGPAPAPASAFTLDDEADDDELTAIKGQQQSLRQQQQQQQLAHMQQGASRDVVGSSSSSHAGGNKKWRAKHSGDAAAAAPDEDTQVTHLLGPGDVSSSSAALGQLAAVQQQQHHHQHNLQLPPASSWWARFRRRLQEQQQQPCSSGGSGGSGGVPQRPCDPGREANVLLTLLGMLRDVAAVARGPERRAFAIACCLAVFDQATASTAIINFAPLVLSERFGVQSATTATLYPVAISAAKAVGVLLALVLVDTKGRKPLLVLGGIACGAALAGAAGALLLASVPLFLLSLCVFTFFFSLSWAGLYWVVVSELFSMGAKSPATSAATSLLFLTGAATNFVFLTAVEVLGAAAFASFGAIALWSALYVWRAVPETKGKTQAEIQALLLAAPAGRRGGAAADGGDAAGGPTRPPPPWPHDNNNDVQGLGGGGGGGGGSACGGQQQQQQQGPSTSGLVEMRQLLAARDGGGGSMDEAATGSRRGRQPQV